MSASGSAEPGDIAADKQAGKERLHIEHEQGYQKRKRSRQAMATLGSLSLATKLEFNSDGMISFAANGKPLVSQETMTLPDHDQHDQCDETANVTMKYSRLSDTFTITSDTDGPGGVVKITNLQGNAFGTNSAFGIGAVSIHRPAPPFQAAVSPPTARSIAADDDAFGSAVICESAEIRRRR